MDISIMVYTHVFVKMTELQAVQYMICPRKLHNIYNNQKLHYSPHFEETTTSYTQYIIAMSV